MNEKIRLTGKVIYKTITQCFGTANAIDDTATIEIEPIELKRQLSKFSLIVVCSSVVEEQQYPCSECGKLRTKAEGGTTFTVCDECWDKKYKEKQLKEMPEVPEFPLGEYNQVWRDLACCVKDMQERIKKIEKTSLTNEERECLNRLWERVEWLSDKFSNDGELKEIIKDIKKEALKVAEIEEVPLEKEMPEVKLYGEDFHGRWYNLSDVAEATKDLQERYKKLYSILEQYLETSNAILEKHEKRIEDLKK